MNRLSDLKNVFLGHISQFQEQFEYFHSVSIRTDFTLFPHCVAVFKTLKLFYCPLQLLIFFLLSLLLSVAFRNVGLILMCHPDWSIPNFKLYKHIVEAWIVKIKGLISVLFYILWYKARSASCQSPTFSDYIEITNCLVYCSFLHNYTLFMTAYLCDSCYTGLGRPRSCARADSCTTLQSTSMDFCLHLTTVGNGYVSGGYPSSCRMTSGGYTLTTSCLAATLYLHGTTRRFVPVSTPLCTIL